MNPTSFGDISINDCVIDGRPFLSREVSIALSKGGRDGVLPSSQNPLDIAPTGPPATAETVAALIP